VISKTNSSQFKTQPFRKTAFTEKTILWQCGDRQTLTLHVGVVYSSEMFLISCVLKQLSDYSKTNFVEMEIVDGRETFTSPTRLFSDVHVWYMNPRVQELSQWTKVLVLGITHRNNLADVVIVQKAQKCRMACLLCGF